MRSHHVIFAISGSRDLKMLAVAGRSLANSCACSNTLVIHLLWAGITANERESVEQSWQDLDLQQVVWHNMVEYLGVLAEEPRSGNYFRCFAGSVIPQDVDRALYLDYDVIVERDVTELWDENLDDWTLAAVWDCCETVHQCGAELEKAAQAVGDKYSRSSGYFNAGVLFFNLTHWREGQWESHLLNFLREHKNWSQFVIQDEINLLLQDQIKPLSPQWNFIDALILYEQWDFDLFSGWDFKPGDDAAIRHFAGPAKPYHQLVRASVKERFYQILDRTTWSGWRSQNDESWWGEASC